MLASISGGTDIVSCFALGVPLRPVHRGEIQCRGLAMAVDIFDDEARPLRGERGELVCTAPFPSMPVGFWNDADGRRYHAAYFERFPGVWHHGDYAALTEHDGLVIYGRSDAVLNPGGVRIGTAESTRRSRRCRRSPESHRGRPGLAGRCARGAVRAPAAGRDSSMRRCGTQIRDVIRAQHDRRGTCRPDRRGAGHPAHALGQDHRTCGAQGRSMACR